MCIAYAQFLVPFSANVVCHRHRELTGIVSSVTLSMHGNPFDIFGSLPASGNHLSFFKRQKSVNFRYQTDVVRRFFPVVVAM